MAASSQTEGSCFPVDLAGFNPPVVLSIRFVKSHKSLANGVSPPLSGKKAKVYQS